MSENTENPKVLNSNKGGGPDDTKEVDGYALAEEYLKEEVDFNELYGLTTGWEQGGFFEDVQDTWAGFRVISESDNNLDSKQEWLFSQVKELNESLEKQQSKWRASPCKDDANGSFVMLQSEIGDTGEFVMMKAKGVQSAYRDGIGTYHTWQVSSMVINCPDANTVISLDPFMKSDPPQLRFVMGFFDWERENLEEKVPQFYNPEDKALGIYLPNLEKNRLFSFFHELSHAKEGDYFSYKYTALLNTSRWILKFSPEGKKSYDEAAKKSKGYLTIDMARKVLEAEERKAWALAGKLMKTIHEHVREKGVRFGNYDDRKQLLSLAEESLNSYDNSHLAIGIEGISTFSQNNRSNIRRATNKV